MYTIKPYQKPKGSNHTWNVYPIAYLYENSYEQFLKIHKKGIIGVIFGYVNFDHIKKKVRPITATNNFNTQTTDR